MSFRWSNGQLTCEWAWYEPMPSDSLKDCETFDWAPLLYPGIPLSGPGNGIESPPRHKRIAKLEVELAARAPRPTSTKITSIKTTSTRPAPPPTTSTAAPPAPTWTVDPECPTLTTGTWHHAQGDMCYRGEQACQRWSNGRLTCSMWLDIGMSEKWCPWD